MTVARNWEHNTIFIGDNLKVMQGMNSGLVDLIYLDPPFNSNHDYAAPIGSEAAGAAFKDTWTLQDVDEKWHGYLADKHPALHSFIASVGEINGDSMKSYLIYMAMRILEMKRLLKPDGSIYLHCDPTASHYLKLLMDAVFGKASYTNEIVWKRTSAHSSTKGWGPVHDTILYYARGRDYVWNSAHQKYDNDYVDKFYRHNDEKGRYRIGDLTASGPRNGESGMPWRGIDPGNRHWAPSRSFPGGESLPDSTHAALDALDRMGRIHWPERGTKPGFKRYLHEMPGVAIQDVVADIRPLAAKSKEKTNYPTQKPLALLERIIKASSNPGDIVFDPFCGCATTCIAAQSLNREWIGIDISPKAGELIEIRMNKELGLFFDGTVTEIPPKRTQSDITENELFQGVKQPKYRDYKYELFHDQKEKCAGCGEKILFKNFHIDHIVPRSKGGGDERKNLQLLCVSCNSRKGTMDDTEFKEMLIREAVEYSRRLSEHHRLIPS